MLFRSLLSLAIFLIAGSLAWPLISEQEENISFDISKIISEDINKVEMERAHYQGIRKNGQPFNITADTLWQNDRKSPLMNMNAPKAHIALSDREKLTIVARSGILNKETQMMELHENVRVLHNSGYEFLSRDLSYDLTREQAHTISPVTGKGPSGYIEAEGLHISQNGAYIKLMGHSKLILYEKP